MKNSVLAAILLFHFSAYAQDSLKNNLAVSGKWYAGFNVGHPNMKDNDFEHGDLPNFSLFAGYSILPKLALQTGITFFRYQPNQISVLKSFSDGGYYSYYETNQENYAMVPVLLRYSFSKPQKGFQPYVFVGILNKIGTYADRYVNISEYHPNEPSNYDYGKKGNKNYYNILPALGFGLRIKIERNLYFNTELYCNSCFETGKSNRFLPDFGVIYQFEKKQNSIEKTPESQAYKNWHIGFKYSLSPYLYTKGYFAFIGGWQFSPKFSLQTGYGYSNHLDKTEFVQEYIGGKYRYYTGNKYTFSEVPLLLKYSFFEPFRHFRPYIISGFTAIFGKNIRENTNYTNDEINYQSVQTRYLSNLFFNYGLGFKIKFKSPVALFAEIQSGKGWRNPELGFYDSFNLGLLYHFPIKKKIIELEKNKINKANE